MGLTAGGGLEREVGAQLAGIVGAGHLLTGEAAAGFAVDGTRPRWVALPGTVGEVSRCLTLAADRRLAVAPSGRGSRLGWGNVPRRLDLVLSVRRLDRVLDWEPEDLTISVEAGVGLSALNAQLRSRRQSLPLDPARVARSSVGGLVATAAAGPYRARYGTMRDSLLGLTVVQADGTVVKGGGRVVKNVTGYDMPKLHVGALGTLGVIVETHLRLHPMPAEEGHWLFGFTSPEAALEAALAIRETPVVVSRLQLLDGTTLARLGARPAPVAGLAVTIGSVPEAVRAQGERIAGVCRGGTAMPLPEPERWWQGASDAAWPGEAETSLALRIGTRPTDVVKAWRAVEAASAGAELALSTTAELANGVLHAVLSGAGVAAAPALVGRVREALAPLGGTCVVEHAPPSVKRELDAWGDVGPALASMRRLKGELDPGGVLNPGRFVGGI